MLCIRLNSFIHWEIANNVWYLTTVSLQPRQDIFHKYRIPDCPFWPLTPRITKAFSSTQLQLTGGILILEPFFVNTRDGCDVMKIPVDHQQVLTLLQPNNQVHHIHDAALNFSRSRLRRCHAIGSLAICVNKQLDISAHKVVGEWGCCIVESLWWFQTCNAINVPLHSHRTLKVAPVCLPSTDPTPLVCTSFPCLPSKRERARLICLIINLNSRLCSA